MLACSILSAVFLLFFCLKAAIIVFTVMSVFFLVYAKRTKYFQRMLVSLLIASLFVLLFVGLFADIIIDFLKSIISSERLVERLILFIDSDSSEANAGASTMNARGELWMISINTWLSNPINFLFGVGAPSPLDYDSGVGNHSDFFDSFARYGLIGCLLIFNSLRMSYKYIITLFEVKVRLQVIVIVILFALFSVVKGVFSPAIGSVMFIIFPISAKLITYNKNQLKRTK